MTSRPSWRLPALLGIGLVVLAAAAVGAGVARGVSVPLTYLHPPPVIARIADATAGEHAVPAVSAPQAAIAARVAPSITILVVGLGLAEAATRAAVGLPPEIALAFSPYADRTVEWQREARDAGHDVLVELPVEPADPARAHLGPQMIRLAGDPDANTRVLEWVMERADRASGLLLSAGVFATAPQSLSPVIARMAAEGLMMVELDGDHLGNAAAAAGARYRSALGPLDRDPQPDAIDRALRGTEESARRAGYVLAFVRPHPVSLARIAAWSASLDGTSVRLARLGDMPRETGSVEGTRP
ncbi:MAG TPA: divergent polysaccharide deacetylase family protein [Geminicoccaceae bacterium]|nr:divergent polysaccharide deacetylase family protein [Geminicoccus sp.]HMU49933.1 divergent polysaccharide deacetylase family protein [Geminicoccaceae bacterium]